MREIPWILASDIDNTLTGDPEALERLGQKLAALRKQGQLLLFLTTGRTLGEVLAGFEQENIPHADAIITQVGTEIYVPPYSEDMEPLPEWDAFLHQKFRRDRAMAFLEDVEGAELQPDYYNTPLKVSYYLDQAPDPDMAVALVEQRVAAERDAYQVIWSSGRHLDILPAAAGKGQAIRFLIHFLGLAPGCVVTAGDSGNDRSMLEAFDCGIIVANAQPELQNFKEKNLQSPLYFAENSFAAGVEEGLYNIGLLK